MTNVGAARWGWAARRGYRRGDSGWMAQGSAPGRSSMRLGAQARSVGFGLSSVMLVGFAGCLAEDATTHSASAPFSGGASGALICGSEVIEPPATNPHD